MHAVQDLFAAHTWPVEQSEFPQHWPLTQAPPQHTWPAPHWALVEQTEQTLLAHSFPTGHCELSQQVPPG